MKLATAICSTLAYSDHFQFPLLSEEIYLRLVGVSTTRPQVINQLKLLVKSGVISQTGDFYHLPSRSHLVTLRRQNAQSSNALYARAQLLASRLSELSSNILAIYLTGSLAVSNATDDADIDLMIITKNNRLWTTRLLLTLYTTIFRMRRTPSSTLNSGKVCLNLYLTPNSYLIPKARQTLYTAYELIQVVPLYDPHDTHTELLSTNSWISKYLPNFPLPTNRVEHIQTPLSSLENWITGLLENVSYRLQLLYMQRKITREYITPHAAFFHPNNPAPKV